MATKVILHGRREGHVRSLTDGAGRETKPSQVAVLPFSEWKRIKEKFSSWQDPAPSRGVEEQRRKETLHQQSKSIVQHWENTIEGQRIKRLEARKLRENKEEKERLKIDKEEAEFQAAERKKGIERAKTLLYYQTDRIKQLNGALVLSEVVRERDVQLLYKKKRQHLQIIRDDKFFELQKKERESATARDMTAAEERSKQRMIFAQHHLEQNEGKTQRRLKERLDSLDEQKRLDEEAIEQQLQRKAHGDESIRKQAELRHELDMVLELKRKADAEEQKQSQVDEERIKIYTKAKKQMENLRKEKQAEFLEDFQDHQQLMCENLQMHMESVTSDEDQRIAEIVKKKIAKRDVELREKRMEYIAASKDIHRHMLGQIAELEQEKKEQALMDKRLLKQRMIQDKKFHNRQLEIQKAAQEEATNLQQFHRSQIEEMKARNDAERKEGLTYDKRNNKLLQVEETQFQQYASKVMDEVRGRGGPLKPLIAAAKEGAGAGHGPILEDSGVRPSYKAMDSVGMELPSYRGGPQNVNTQKRLGFMW